VPDDADSLRELYTAFNARDVDAVLAALAPDVDWPNAWRGGRLRGHDEVRAYWAAQWAEIDPHVEPLGIAPTADGRLAVDVHQRVRALDGTVLVDGRVTHVYTLRDGLVVRMDVSDPDGS
jgi:ketosteroid isomerase-like protein